MKGLIAVSLVAFYSLLGYIFPGGSEFYLKTLDYQPTCMGSPGTFVDFMYYLEHNNNAKVSELVNTGKCGFTKEGIDAKILEEGEGWVKVLLAGQGNKFVLFMSRESLAGSSSLEFREKREDKSKIHI